MRSDAGNVGLRDGTHAELVESSGEESGESRDIRNGAVTASGSDGYSHQVLLGDETLDVTLG